ncbi:hypothetical protein J3458_022126 [Metarhizium acridum]|uniref:uncharacterized protein n=1 Tax=Metarhizium acridum TaxID=92637 RepID=UPI001C6B2111|nr:hypothetical protein J3458_022126 [Metarhizium acridum]
MTLIEEIGKLRGDASTMIGICEGASSEAVEEGFKLEVLRRARNLSQQVEIMVKETAILETQLQASRMAQAEMRRELDKLQETFNSRLHDQVNKETEKLKSNISERMEKQPDSRFIALATEVRRADAEIPPCQMERETRLDEKEQRLCEMEKRLTERQESLDFRETSLRETRNEVNSRMRELAADRDHSFEHVRELLDDRFLTIQAGLADLNIIRKLQDDFKEQQAALRDLASKSDIDSVVSRLSVLPNLVEAMASLLSVEQVHAIVSNGVSNLVTRSDLESLGLLDNASDRVPRRDITNLTAQVLQANTDHEATLAQLRQGISNQVFLRLDLRNLVSKIDSIASDLPNRSVVAELASTVLRNNDARDSEHQAQTADLAEISAKVDVLNNKLADTNLAKKADVVELANKVDALNTIITKADFPKNSDITTLANRVLNIDLDRETASQKVSQAVSLMSENLAKHLEALTNWRGATTPDSLQTTLGELVEIVGSIKQQIDGTSEVVGQISSDLGKLGGPTPPLTTEAGKPKWLYKYQSLRFWDSAIDEALSDLTILNVVGAENMEPKEVSRLLLDTLQPANIESAIHLVCEGPAETWFCFRGFRFDEQIEVENDFCPFHEDCIFVKRIHFNDEDGRPSIGLKFRKPNAC